jgi:hypothetical protein
VIPTSKPPDFRKHGRTWDELGFRSEVNVLGSCRRIPGLAFKVFGPGKSPGTDDLNPQKNSITGWWFGTFFIFPYIGINDPN